MINAGFNPLNTMAEKTGKSIAALKKEMSDGKISAAMVQQAFIDATSEGGKYYQMSEKASQTLGGQMSMLSDASDLMFNEMGQGMEDVLNKIIAGATAIVENWKTVGRIITSVISVYGIYKTTAMAAEFADKKAAEERGKAIVDGYQRQIDALNKYEAAKTAAAGGTPAPTEVEKPVEVIDKINKGKAITESEASELEAYAISLAEKRVQLTDESVKKTEEQIRLNADDLTTQRAKTDALSQQLRDKSDIVKQLQQELEFSKQMDQANGLTADSTRTQDKQIELDLALEDERAVMIARNTELLEIDRLETEEATLAAQLQNATEQAGIAITERDNLVRQANTSAVNANSVANQGNAASQTATTAATNRNRVSAALHTAGLRIQTTATHLARAATEAYRNALDSLKAAWATNPLGLMLTVITTLGTALWSFVGGVNDAKEETKRFAMETEKTVDDVRLFYNVLEVTDKNSQIYKTTLEKLAKTAKDYGLTIDDETDKYTQLIALKEKMIQLIIEESRQREIADNIAKIRDKRKSKDEDFKEDIGEQVEKHNRGNENVNDRKDSISDLVLGDVETNAQKVADLADKIKELEKRYFGYLREGNHALAKVAREESEKLTTELESIALGSANQMIGNYNGNKLELKTPTGVNAALLNYIHAQAKNVLATNREIASYTAASQASQGIIDASKSAPEPYTIEGKDAAILAKDFTDSKDAIAAAKAELDSAKKEAAEADAAFASASKTLGSIGEQNPTPNVDASSVDTAKSKAESAGAAVGKLNTKVTVKATSTGLDGLLSTAQKISNYLSPFLNILDPNKAANDKRAADNKVAAAQSKLDTEVEKNKKALQGLLAQVKTVNSDDDFKNLRLKLGELKSKFKRSDKEYKQIVQAIERLDKRDQATNGKTDTSAPDRALRNVEQRRAEEQRQEELAFNNRIRAWELRISKERDMGKKEREQIKLNHEKKMHELKNAVRKEAETLEKNDVDAWVNGGKDRNKAKYYQRFTPAQLKQMRDKYTRVASQNIDEEGQRQSILQETMKSGLETLDKSRIQVADDPYTEAMKEIYKNRETMLYVLDLQKDDLLRQFQDKKIAEAAKNGKEIKREDITYEQMIEEQYANGNEIFKEGIAQINAGLKVVEDAKVKSQRDAYNQMIADCMTYEQQRLKIEQEYAAKRNRLYEKDKDGNVIKDADGKPILRAGVTQENVDEINRQMQEALDNLQFGDVQNYTRKRKKAEEEIERNRKKLYKTDENGKEVLADNVTEQDAENFKRRSADTLAAIDREFASKQEQFQAWCNQISEYSLLALEDAITKAEGELTALTEKGEENADPNLLAEIRAKLATLKQQKREMEVSIQADPKKQNIKEWGELQTAIGKTSKSIRSMGSAFSELGSEWGETVGEILNGVADVADSAIEMTTNIVNLVNFSSQSIQTTSKLGKEAISSLEKASLIIGIISTAIQLAMAAARLFNSDKKHDKKIKDLGLNIDDLKRKYQDLERAASRAFSTDKAKIIDKENKNLRQQQNLIRQQMEEEKASKKPDKDKIREYQSQINDINQQIRDNKEAMTDSILGEDIMSAISNFSDAYASMFDEGMGRAKASKDLVKNMIKRMIMEALKADLSKPMEKLREMLKGYYTDGVVDLMEQDAMVHFAEEEMDKMRQKYAWADRFFDNTDEQEATAGGFTTMSQESADELSGRFASLQVTGDAIRAQAVQQSMSLASINAETLKQALKQNEFTAYHDGLQRRLAEMYIELQTISENTGAIVKPIKDMQYDIAQIKYNTQKL